jgi:tetrahydromethanopterin S-methyltransferase subunit G
MDDWNSKITLAMIPVLMGGAGWVLSLESRIQVIDARQQERSLRFEHVEKQISAINGEVMDPKPKPETRVAMQTMTQDIERLKDEIQRVNERVNNLHAYFMQVVPRPPFNPQRDGRRGDLFPEYPQRQP